MTTELIIAIFAAAISLISLGFTIAFYYHGVGRERKRDTLDAFNRLQNEALDALHQYTESEIDEIIQDSHSKEYKALSTLLARCEHFAVGVNHRTYNVKIVQKLAASFLIPLYDDKLAKVIRKKRQDSPEEKHYADLEAMILNLRVKQSRHHK